MLTKLTLDAVVVPAAGLGTRLYPRTRTTPKELIPLGGVPVIWSAVLEAEAAGVPELVVVVSPGKRAVAEWVQAHAPASLRVRVALQPEPAGVVDAVRRAAVSGRYAVVYPDYVAPKQGALAQLCAAARHASEASWYGVFAATPAALARVGATARVRFAPGLDGVAPITGLAPTETGWRTTFAEIRGPRHDALLAGGPADDRRVGGVLAELAAERALWGARLPGPILDMGVPAGLADAEARFADGRAKWRRRPAGWPVDAR